MKHDKHLDAKGLNCPLPILKTKLLIHKMEAGQILWVEATDPHSEIDFKAWCAQTGHELAEMTKGKDGVFSFYILRKG